MSKLKPCPFCGGKAIMTEIMPHTHKIAAWMPDYSGGVFIECNECTCAMSAETKKDAIEKWNKRETEQERIQIARRVLLITRRKNDE